MTYDEHILTILAEECLETAKRCTKALRFGMAETQPGKALNNAARIYEEYADILASMEMLRERYPNMGEELPSLGALIDAKRIKVNSFLEYSASLGTLEP